MAAVVADKSRWPLRALAYIEAHPTMHWYEMGNIDRRVIPSHCGHCGQELKGQDFYRIEGCIILEDGDKWRVWRPNAKEWSPYYT